MVPKLFAAQPTPVTAPGGLTAAAGEEGEGGVADA